MYIYLIKSPKTCSYQCRDCIGCFSCRRHVESSSISPIGRVFIAACAMRTFPFTRFTYFSLSLHQILDGGNAVPLYLASEAHGAKQLGELCKYWMATDLNTAMKHEQWIEVRDDVKSFVKEEHQRLLAAREQKKEEKMIARQMPCLLAPVVPSINTP